MVSIVWTIIVLLVVLWLAGLILGIAGGFIHILIVVAVVLLLYNLLAGRSTT